jgi:CheY-like chemotaxis protein
MTSSRNPFSKTILVVEDEPDTAEMLQEMLRLSGYDDVVHIYEGNNALPAIFANHPDVVLSDISGLEVLCNIRRIPEFEHLPVILVSGNNHPSDIQDGYVAGASTYLTKPISLWELKESLDNLIDKAGGTASTSSPID